MTEPEAHTPDEVEGRELFPVFEPPTMPLYAGDRGARILNAVHDVHAREQDLREAVDTMPSLSRWITAIVLLTVGVLAALVVHGCRTSYVGWGLLVAELGAVTWLSVISVRWHRRVWLAQEARDSAQRRMKRL